MTQELLFIFTFLLFYFFTFLLFTFSTFNNYLLLPKMRSR